VTTVAEVLNIMSVCLYSCLTYPAYAELHCHLWRVRPYHFIPHYLTNGTIFGGLGGRY